MNEFSIYDDTGQRYNVSAMLRRGDMSSYRRIGEVVQDMGDSSIKVAGCAMPLSLHVNNSQRKANFSLGISVRTGLGDSEEWVTGATTFAPGAQVNITVPIVPCREMVHALIMRVINASEALILDGISSNVKGTWRKGAQREKQFRVDAFKTLVDLEAGPF